MNRALLTSMLNDISLVEPMSVDDSVFNDKDRLCVFIWGPDGQGNGAIAQVYADCVPGAYTSPTIAESYIKDIAGFFVNAPDVIRGLMEEIELLNDMKDAMQDRIAELERGRMF